MHGQPDGPQRIPGIHPDVDGFGPGDDHEGGRPRLNRVWWALLWLLVIVLAILPIPWW